MKRPVVTLLVATLVAGFLAGCGEGTGIGETASAVLTPHVEAIRAAATDGDRERAMAALAALRLRVADLGAAGELSDRAAASVLEAALDVERQLSLLPAGQADTGAGDRTATTTGDDDEDDDPGKVAEEARKRAEEAAKKAEEEAKKRAEEARKRAEEAAKKE